MTVTRHAKRDGVTVTHEDRDATPPGIASRSEARCEVGEEKQAGAEAPENKHATRTAQHKAKLAADPRFAAWQARFAAWQGLSPAVAAGLQLDPFFDPEAAE